MGWTFSHRDKGITNDEWFRSEFPTSLQERGEIVASATVKGTYYAAVKQHATGEVWALVVLTQWVPKDWFNFGYKEMSDSMGPGADEAPAKVLDALTPTGSEWANDWRERCRVNLYRNQQAKLAGKAVKTGDIVKFDEPFVFTNGYTGDTFTFVERNEFRSGYSRLNIRNWKFRAFQVIGHDDTIKKSVSRRVTHSLLAPDHRSIKYVYGKEDLALRVSQFPDHEIHRGKLTWDKVERLPIAG